MMTSYQYEWSSTWGDTWGPHVNWVLLHPRPKDDREHARMRKMKSISRAHGFDGMFVTYLYAALCDEKKDLRSHRMPVGKETNHHLEFRAKCSRLIVAAWGNFPHVVNRDLSALAILRSVHREVACIGTTLSGNPLTPSRHIWQQVELVRYPDGSPLDWSLYGPDIGPKAKRTADVTDDPAIVSHLPHTSFVKFTVPLFPDRERRRGRPRRQARICA